MNTTITLVLGGLLLFNLIGLVAALAANGQYRRRLKYLEGALRRFRRQAHREELAAAGQRRRIAELTDRNQELERSLHRAERSLRELEQRHQRLRKQFRQLVRVEGRPVEEHRCS